MPQSRIQAAIRTNPVNDETEHRVLVDVSGGGDGVDVLQRVRGTRDATVDPANVALDLQDVLIHLKQGGIITELEF